MQTVHVAVGVILDADRNILLTRRHDHLHQGGLWEFPGGKVGVGENVSTALSRELREELDITPVNVSPLIEIHHDYGDKSVLLDVHVVWEFSGEPRGLEGQPMVWVSADELSDYKFPAANKPIVAAILQELPQGFSRPV